VDQNIYFPVFDRSIEESIAAQGVITPEIKLVITEGNYLLHNDNNWGGVKKFLDEEAPANSTGAAVSTDQPKIDKNNIKKYQVMSRRKPLNVSA
jgi:hypothetical protein